MAYKKELVRTMLEILKPIHEKRAYYNKHSEFVDEVFIKGTEQLVVLRLKRL